MFVSTESFRRNPKTIFYNKRLPKGNKSERLVSQFLELSVNPKGNLAYKYFLTMTEKKNLSICGCSHTSDTVCLRNEQKALFLLYKVLKDYGSKWYVISISKKGCLVKFRTSDKAFFLVKEKTLYDAMQSLLQKLIDYYN